MAYIRITRACIGIERSRHLDTPISRWFFYEGEIFKVERVYNYYEKDNEHWNTEHPIVILEFVDSKTFKLLYEIPPDCYIYMAEEDVLSVTMFSESDLVEREDLLVENKESAEKAVEYILEKYLEVSKLRLNEYKWEKKDENI